MIKIGISSCLLGERVRYNGGHKRAPFLEALDTHVEWVPVCPEVEVGMGVPREPVRLERAGSRTRMIAVESGIDHTAAMNAWAQERIDALIAEGISGYVLKKDSPSCGLHVDLHEAGVRVSGDGRGLFAEALVARLPRLPVAEEDRLSDEAARDAFLHRCIEYARTVGTALEPFRPVNVVRYGRGLKDDRDVAATEEPLEIRLHGRPFCVTMRTPGSDRALAAGFLFSEGVIHSADDIGAVEHCRHPEHPEVHNVVDVFLIGAAAKSLDARLAERRNVLTTSACGLCGRTAIDSLRVRADRIASEWTIAADVAASLPARLRDRQAVFGETGGLHAAGLFTRAGDCEGSAEDIGRHNAVDKVVGAMLLAGRLPLRQHALTVSGRASYEIVQKAWLAGIPIVCAVSAPSTLAIDLAREAGITLLGFVRDGGFNVYTHEMRVEGSRVKGQGSRVKGA